MTACDSREVEGGNLALRSDYGLALHLGYVI